MGNLFKLNKILFNNGYNSRQNLVFKLNTSLNQINKSKIIHSKNETKQVKDLNISYKD